MVGEDVAGVVVVEAVPVKVVEVVEVELEVELEPPELPAIDVAVGTAGRVPEEGAVPEVGREEVVEEVGDVSSSGAPTSWPPVPVDEVPVDVVDVVDVDEPAGELVAAVVVVVVAEGLAQLNDAAVARGRIAS